MNADRAFTGIILIINVGNLNSPDKLYGLYNTVPGFINNVTTIIRFHIVTVQISMHKYIGVKSFSSKTFFLIPCRPLI